MHKNTTTTSHRMSRWLVVTSSFFYTILALIRSTQSVAKCCGFIHCIVWCNAIESVVVLFRSPAVDKRDLWLFVAENDLEKFAGDEDLSQLLTTGLTSNDLVSDLNEFEVMFPVTVIVWPRWCTLLKCLVDARTRMQAVSMHVVLA